MSTYEERQAAKLDRLNRRIERAKHEAEAQFARSEEIVGRIPMGQPILVGHHSERRHRRDLERSDAAMRKALEAQHRARLAERAIKAHGRSIDADDPEALAKLRSKLEEIESTREAIKARNRAARKAGEEPTPGYVLTNLGAQARKIRERIEEIENIRKAAEQVAYPIGRHDAFALEIREEDGSLVIDFDNKPEEARRKALKSRGFRWRPSQGVWGRKLTLNALGSARWLLEIDFPKERI